VYLLRFIECIAYSLPSRSPMTAQVCSKPRSYSDWITKTPCGVNTLSCFYKKSWLSVPDISCASCFTASSSCNAYHTSKFNHGAEIPRHGINIVIIVNHSRIQIHKSARCSSRRLQRQHAPRNQKHQRRRLVSLDQLPSLCRLEPVRSVRQPLFLPLA
jgi:hypothetical protein